MNAATRRSNTVISSQWFIRVLDLKDQLLELGDQVTWHPDHMRLALYRHGLKTCLGIGHLAPEMFWGSVPGLVLRPLRGVKLAAESSLPVDPEVSQPESACACGSTDFVRIQT